jgi:hypothetical protein
MLNGTFPAPTVDGNVAVDGSDAVYLAARITTAARPLAAECAQALRDMAGDAKARVSARLAGT